MGLLTNDSRLRSSLLLAAICFGAASAAAGDNGDRAGVDFFEKRIRPILVTHCYECHSEGAKELKGGLSVQSRSGLRDGGDSGPAVVPGAANEGQLLAALRYETFQMPPKGRLPDRVIADFERWIDMGAPDPRDGPAGETPPPEDAGDHWAFRPMEEPAIPTVPDGWARGPIDRFVGARLQREGLSPVGDAAPATLVRRLSFDLLGLPPSPEEVRAFLADDAPDAYERLVERLLALPHFGERWGRHWLDVMRFAESNGGDRNVVFPHAWRYRRYVIDAFNADKPYDVFVREQVAGDLLPGGDSSERDERRIATGMLTLGPKQFMETDAEQFRLDVIDEQMDVFGRATLGIAFGCARCHDHKFDPISQREYYALAGVFGGADWLWGPAAPAGNQYGHDRPLEPVGPDAEKLHGPALRWQEEVAEQTAKRSKARSDRYRFVRQKQAHENRLAALRKDKSESEQEADAEIQELVAAIATCESEIAAWDEKVAALDAELKALEENPPPMPGYAMAVREAETVEDCRLRIRGETSRRGEVVPRGAPGFLPVAAAPIPEGASGRLQLAEWLTSPENPLFVRVMANRVWQRLLGEGLVPTVDNFGSSGEPPTHPELLEHLACRFRQSGYSVKSLVQEIVLSRTYRLSSSPDGNPAQSADPSATLLWRARTRRLEAEAIRDALLVAGGELRRSPPLRSPVADIAEREFNARVRLAPEQSDLLCRTVYLPVVRQSVPTMLKVFDFPDPSLPRGRRTERTMAAQQLFMLNDEFVLARADASAERILHEAGEDSRRIDTAYLRFFGRSPTEVERERALAFLRSEACADDLVGAENASWENASREAWRRLCHALLASAEFRYLR